MEKEKNNSIWIIVSVVVIILVIIAFYAGQNSNNQIQTTNAQSDEILKKEFDIVKPQILQEIIKALEQLILSYCAPYQKQMATYIAQSEAKIKAQLELVKAMLEGHDSKTGIKCHINLVDKDGKPLMSIVPLHL